MLAVREVSKTYKRGEAAALNDVSVEVNDGEFLVLLGPSGSGKSTLLRAIAGLETIDDGQIELNGRPVSHLSPRRRKMAMVFQDYALYPHMSVAGNIAYNMRLRKVAHQEIERRVHEAAAMLGIEHLLKRKPAALSGGERQRVAVARAITRDAEVLLMDEPLSNLDAQIREHVRIELRELQRRLHLTTVYVTHDQVEAMVMADRVVVLRNGRVQQCGTPADIYRRPANLFCARFIGAPKINEVAGEARCAEGRLEWRLGPQKLTMGAVQGHDVQLDAEWRRCVLAFRPEGARPCSGGLEAKVAMTEDRGAERYLVVNLAGESEAAQQSTELRVRAGDFPEDGDLVQFSVEEGYVFDPDDGKRLAVMGATGKTNPPARALGAGMAR